MSGFRPRFFAPIPGGGTHRGAPPAAAGLDAGMAAGPGKVVTLDPEDSHHALHVLRLRPGDECEVVVGAAVYAATVLKTASGGSTAQVELELDRRLEGTEAGASYRFPVALFQAFVRPTALEFSIEKSTETGVGLVVLLPAAGSPRLSGKEATARLARLARIAREAAKQSKQPAIPEVEPAPSLAAALERASSEGLFSLVLDPRAEESLYDVVLGRAGSGGVDSGVALWVGPEGGWSEGEYSSLVRAGARPTKLGRGVLRAETAGPVAVAVARLALGDW